MGERKSLNNRQRYHIDRLCRAAACEIEAKYVNGAAEHGGNLWDLSEEALLDAAIEEQIDGLVYLLTIRDKARGREREADRDDMVARETELIRVTNPTHTQDEARDTANARWEQRQQELFAY